MADSDLIKAQNEAAKQAKEDTNRQITAISKLIEQGKGDSKDRVKLLKMQADLKQTQQTLSGDLGKNINDMKDGFASTVNGMINQTFGPLGGMVTSLTTGFFKRGKENRENITQNELQNDNAKEMIEKLGGIQEAVEGVDKKTLAPDKDIDNKKAAANGGEVVAGEEESKGFGIMLLRFLGMVGAAIAGLAAGAAVGVVGYLTGWVKLLGKTITGLISKIPTPKWLDEVIDALKNFGGNAFTKIKNFFVGETSVFKRIGTLVDSVVDTLKGFTGGVFTRIKNFFVGETSIFKRVGTIVDGAKDWIKGAFGESNVFSKVKSFFTGETSIFKRVGTIVDSATDAVKGFSGGMFTKISGFFTGESSIFKRVTGIVDSAGDALKAFDGGMFGKISGFFTGEGSVFKRIGGTVDGVTDTVKGFSGGIFDSVKGVFKSVSGVGDTIMAPIKGIMDFFPGGKGEGGIIGKILGFLTPFKSVFSAFARLGAKLVAPLNIIIGIFDAGFETKDAVDKSDGFFATLFNGIIGAIGGFIDGAIMSLLDLVKDGISWVAEKLGFGDVSKKLDSFSFSKILNDALDKVYVFFNELFNFDLAAMASSLIPEDSFLRKFVPESLFQSSEKAEEKKEGAARGGFIVNQPTYLPNSGVVVGEHGTYSGNGLAYGGIADGGPEAVIPLSSSRAGAFIDPMARSVAGQVINQLAMERIGMDSAGGGGATVVTDARSSQTNNNTTVINNPSPIGQTLPDEGRDFVSKVA